MSIGYTNFVNSGVLAMGALDDIARQRIAAWLKASGKTQTALADAIGRNQAWMSRYLDGDFDADLDTLEKMARAHGHTLFHLLGVNADPAEDELLQQFRAIRPDARELLLKLLVEWTRSKGPRVRTRPRSDE